MFKKRNLIRIFIIEQQTSKDILQKKKGIKKITSKQQQRNKGKERKYKRRRKRSNIALSYSLPPFSSSSRPSPFLLPPSVPSRDSNHFRLITDHAIQPSSSMPSFYTEVGAYLCFPFFRDYSRNPVFFPIISAASLFTEFYPGRDV